MSNIEVSVERPDTEVLMRSADEHFELARAYVLDSPDMYEMAAEELKGVKAAIAELDRKRKAITRPMDEAKKEVMALFGPPLARMKEAESALKVSLLSYQREVERELRREQAKLEQVAREKRERLEAEAAALKAQGKEEEADAVADEASQSFNVVQAEPVKAKGVTIARRWDFELEDLSLLVKAIAKGDVPNAFVSINAAAIRTYIRSFDGDVEIPGVRVTQVEDVRASAA